ncbi:hypothetical protein STEG23_012265, partial [Scotinomys teguina]
MCGSSPSTTGNLPVKCGAGSFLLSPASDWALKKLAPLVFLCELMPLVFLWSAVSPFAGSLAENMDNLRNHNMDPYTEDGPAISESLVYLRNNSQNTFARTWNQPRCPSTEEWIRKMWHMYTMEYYAAEKNNDIMKFAGKWMDLENAILSE